jgi:hypothetical protein
MIHLKKTLSLNSLDTESVESTSLYSCVLALIYGVSGIVAYLRRCCLAIAVASFSA